MAKLEFQLDDVTYCTEYEDVDAIIDEMVNHKDVRVLMDLKARQLLTEELTNKILDDIYEDARAYIKKLSQEEDDYDVGGL